jgi:hypothetical protein
MVQNMKKFSPFLAVMEMQIKTTLRFHLTPIRMAIVKNTTNHTCVYCVTIHTSQVTEIAKMPHYQ